jgi:hypothetical protein
MLQLPHDPVPLHSVATEVVAQWPPGTFLENLALGVAGPTAVAVGPESTPTVYVSTTGGLLSPPRDDVEPARLLRMDVTTK